MKRLKGMVGSSLNSVLNVKAVIVAFNQEKALVGAFSVITNLRMELFEALVHTTRTFYHLGRTAAAAAASRLQRGTHRLNTAENITHGQCYIICSWANVFYYHINIV